MNQIIFFLHHNGSNFNLKKISKKSTLHWFVNHKNATSEFTAGLRVKNCGTCVEVGSHSHECESNNPVMNVDKTFNGDVTYIMDDLAEKMAKESMTSNPADVYDEVRNHFQKNYSDTCKGLTRNQVMIKVKNLRRVSGGYDTFKTLLEDKLTKVKDSNYNFLQSIFG